jgi:hypothetical protein
MSKRTVEPSASPLVPRLDVDEQERRAQEVVRLLDSWESEGDKIEQKETISVLRSALGSDRIAASRELFP